MQMNSSSRRSAGRRLPLWLILLIYTLVLALVITVGFCAVMGKPGLTMVKAYLLAKFAFVEVDADLDSAVNQGLDSFVNGLGDRWSYFLDPEDLSATTERRANSYVGVGITVLQHSREDGLVVQAVTKDGPAEKAGIVPGDVITAIDGTPMTPDNQETSTDLIRGEAGTEVTLTVLHEDGTSEDIVCKRATVHNASASNLMLEDNLGLVRLENFYSGSAASFKENVEALLAQQPDGLVIDVRSNPGGYVDELESILDYLLPEGPVFRMKPRWGTETVKESDADCIDLPMVVLVNADTYSAAELLAAQLRESVGAKIVGEVTSGKGYSQMTYSLPNGSGMGISTAEYTTGGGHSLIGEGITPDVDLNMDRSIPLLGEADTQLQAAVELLLQRD